MVLAFGGAKAASEELLKDVESAGAASPPEVPPLHAAGAVFIFWRRPRDLCPEPDSGSGHGTSGRRPAGKVTALELEGSGRGSSLGTCCLCVRRSPVPSEARARRAQEDIGGYRHSLPGHQGSCFLHDPDTRPPVLEAGDRGGGGKGKEPGGPAGVISRET